MHSMTHAKLSLSTLAFACAFAFAAMGCTPGYIKAADLDRHEQGPTHCAARCSELGMEMGALVLVSNTLPGCVCQPKGTHSPAAEAPQKGASGATTGMTVILAAAAAARQQQMQAANAATYTRR